MPLDVQRFEVYPLRGMDQRHRAQPTAATILRDLSWDDRDGWEPCGGYRRLVLGGLDKDGRTRVDPYLNSGKVTSLACFSQHNGSRKFLVYETDQGELRVYNPSKAQPWDVLEDAEGNQHTGRQVARAAETGTATQAWGGRLIIVNGYDAPLVYDGTKAERAGFDAAPPAPSASPLGEEVTGSGANYAIGWYWALHAAFVDGTDYSKAPILNMGLGAASASQADEVPCAYVYAVSFVNERGQESPLSPVSGIASFRNPVPDADPFPITAVDYSSFSNITRTWGRFGTLVNVPLGPPNTVARRVYRSRNLANSAGEMLSAAAAADTYFLKEIQDNCTTTYEDYVPDGLLSSLVDRGLLGTFPHGAKMLAVYQNTLFAAGMSANELRYSRALYPEVFPPDNVIQVGEADLGPITGMYPTKGALVVFKASAIFLVRGDAGTGFYALPLTRDSGCVAPRSIKELPGLGLVFAAADGVYLLEGALQNEGTPTRVVKLSQPISETYKRANRAAMLGAVAEVYHRDREYWLAMPTLGSTDPNLVLVYHYDIGAWSYREDFPIACMVETRDARGYLIFGSWDDTGHPGLHVYSKGWEDKDGVAIRPLYRGANLAFGSLYTSFSPKKVHVNVLAFGENTVTFNYYINRELEPVREEEAEHAQQHQGREPYAVFGTAELGTSYWADPRPVTLPFGCAAEEGHGPVQELQVEVSWSGRSGYLIGYDVEAAVGEHRKIRPMSSFNSPDRG